MNFVYLCSKREMGSFGSMKCFVVWQNVESSTGIVQRWKLCVLSRNSLDI